jgi:hypothetical protein
MRNDVNFACGWRIWQTDTASVLMEAIGYIKFLQNQVEVFSLPDIPLESRFSYATCLPLSDASETSYIYIYIYILKEYNETCQIFKDI